MTTLITTIHGIGLGVMGSVLAKHIPSIKTILARDLGDFYGTNNKLDLTNPHVENVITFSNIDQVISQRKKWESNKYVYIENSYQFASLAHRMNLSGERIYIPMWEQGSTIAETKDATQTISVTYKTQEFLSSNGFNTAYIPWPVEVPTSYVKRSKFRKLLHNAGSLGGNLRKGTYEAIAIYQTSNLAQKGVSLTVHSWKEAPSEIATLIARKSEGITWSNRFYPNYLDIYNEFDALLFPSKLEGHAMVVMEAMAQGLPVLYTDAAPMNEYSIDPILALPVKKYLKHSDLNGPYNLVDIDSAAKKLVALSEMDLQSLSEQSYELMNTKFSWSVLLPKWKSILE
jgi:glycosyltransferase involved in cell wall biosynthesis